MSKEVIIYTDGSCLNNPGAGGYAAILRYGDTVKEIWGGEPAATNNQMELLAAIKALEQLKRPCKVSLHTDSQYVMNAFVKGWLESWRKKNWQTAARQPVKNRELWERLSELNDYHTVSWQHVRGHQGQSENERCDELARNAAAQARETGAFFACSEQEGK